MLSYLASIFSVVAPSMNTPQQSVQTCFWVMNSTPIFLDTAGLFFLGIEGRLDLLDSVPGVVDDGAVGSQLVHVGLHNEHLVAVGLEDVQGGCECCRTWRQSSQSWLPQ